MSLVKIYRKINGEYQQFGSHPTKIPGFAICIPVVVPVKVCRGKNGADLWITARCKHCQYQSYNIVKFPKSRLAKLDWAYPNADSEFSRFIDQGIDSVCDDCAKELHKATCVPHGVNSQYNHLLSEHSNTTFCDVCLITLENLRL